MQQINLQVYPRGVNPIIQISQYDKGRQLQLNLYDGASKYNIPAGSEVLFEGQKPDGTIFSYEAAYAGNVVTISIAQQATLIPGRTTCELRILNGDSVNIGTINFTMYVEASPVNGDYPVSETDIPAIIDLGQQYAERAEDAAERAEADAALADEAATLAQTVLNSIPEEYSDLSDDVVTLKSEMETLYSAPVLAVDDFSLINTGTSVNKYINVSDITGDAIISFDVIGNKTNESVSFKYLENEVEINTYPVFNQNEKIIITRDLTDITTLKFSVGTSGHSVYFTNFKIFQNELAEKFEGSLTDYVFQSNSDFENHFDEIDDAVGTKGYFDITSELSFDRSGYFNQYSVSFTSNENTRSGVLEVKSGEKYRVSGYPYYGCQLLKFCPKNSVNFTTVIPNSSTTSYSTGEITIPSDGFLCLGTDYSKISDFKFEKYGVIYEDLNPLAENIESKTFITNINFDSVNNGYIKTDGTVGSYDSTKYGSKSNLASGDVYTFYCTAGSNIRSYVIKDSNGNVTRSASSETWGTIHHFDQSVTIQNNEAGGTLYINTLQPAFLALEKLNTGNALNGKAITDGSIEIDTLSDSINPLYEKKILFDGDSICYGTDKTGWASRIGYKNHMDWYNYGVRGGTITAGTYSGDNPRHWESTDIATMHAAHPDADYVILESCLNDGFIGLEIGELSNGYDGPFDYETFSGAVEYMLQQSITLFPNAKIGVIIPHRVNSNLKPWHDFVKSACEKWSIPYIDLFHDSGLCVNVSAQASIMFSDGVTHLSEAGYDFITPKIEAWIRSL